MLKCIPAAHKLLLFRDQDSDHDIDTAAGYNDTDSFILGQHGDKKFQYLFFTFTAAFGNTKLQEVNAYQRYKNTVGEEITCSKRPNFLFLINRIKNKK